MIYDSIQNIRLYKGIHPALDAAIEQLLETDLLAYEVGRHVWNEDTYVNVQSVDYLEFGRWEKHDHYADIQISLNGGESGADFDRAFRIRREFRDFAIRRSSALAT